MTVTIAGTTGTTQPTATCTTSLVLNGSSSGTTTVQAAATASGTITVPAGTGTVAVNGVSSNIYAVGAQTATGTETYFDFLNIPSWAKRITILLKSVQLSGTSGLLYQIGTGGVPTTSGYIGNGNNNGTANLGSTAGIPVYNNVATYVLHGKMVWENINGNIWVATGSINTTQGANLCLTSGGFGSLSGTLNMVRIKTINGAETFASGSVLNAFYE